MKEVNQLKQLTESIDKLAESLTDADAVQAGNSITKGMETLFAYYMSGGNLTEQEAAEAVDEQVRNEIDEFFDRHNVDRFS